jgi:hypothetical protein
VRKGSAINAILCALPRTGRVRIGRFQCNRKQMVEINSREYWSSSLGFPLLANWQWDWRDTRNWLNP